MDKLKMQTADKTMNNIEQIANLFPSVMSEGKIDFDLLKQMLSDKVVDGDDERYRLDWVGKKASLLKANSPINKTLRPCREDSVDFDNTQNLYIEGDNFEVLKLIQESYLNKIKMIYIDPPYNTGKDFVYRDNFTKSKSEHEEDIGLRDEDGNKLFKNTDSNGRFHSDWLSMMYERLLVSRDLLKDDGVIFISIDDNEVHNLRKICDEVFGENNFIGEFIWKKKQGGGNDSNVLVIEHEYIIAYTKMINNFTLNLDTNYKLDDSLYPFRDNNGEYGLVTLDKSSIRFSDSLVFDIKDIDGNIYYPRIVKGKQSCWRWGKEKVKNEFDKLVFKNGKVYTKYYRPKGITPKSLLVDTIYGRTETGNDDIKKIFDNEKPFTYPKPLALICHLAMIGSRDDDIILDFFSGSATTAHAVMQLNAEDSGSRKYICIQLQEKTDNEKFLTIPEIGKERIRRAGKKIVEENKDKEGIETLDIGFRVLKADSTNFKDVYYHPDELSQSLFQEVDAEDNIKEDRTDLDLLFQIMLDLGVELSLKITPKVIDGTTIYLIENNELIACLEDNISMEVIEEIKKLSPYQVVLKDSCFSHDKDKINAVESLSKTCTVSVI